MAAPRPGRPTLLSVALGLAMAVSMLAACSTQQTPESTGTAPPVDASSARRLIEAADLARPETIDALGAVRFTRAGGEAARAVLSAGGSTDVLWAAVWVYASAAGDPATLKPILQNGDPSLRVMAAAAVIASGDRDGFTVLRDALGDDSSLAGSHPPLTISGFAVATLFQYAGGTGAPTETDDASQLAGVVDAWRGWLQSHAATLVFDQGNGTWSAP